MKLKVIAVPTEEISKIVQERLFELGYEWPYNGKNYHGCTLYGGKNTYIYLNETLRYDNRKYFMKDKKYEEITMYDLYQMEPIKDTITLTTEDGDKIEISKKSLEELKKL